jgi:hypothetical protein
MARAKRLTADAMLGASSLCTVVAGVSIINPQVRSQISSVIGSEATGQLAAMASRAVDFLHTFTRLAGDSFPDSTPLAGFAILAVILTVMMVRS